MFKKVNEYDTYCSRAAVPLHATHFETREVLELLIDKGHFLEICSHAFGPVIVSNASPHSTCWMDEANAHPDSPAADALFKLLSPTGSLCRILEGLSVPHEQNMSKWRDENKGKNSAEEVENFFSKTFDLPLSTFCSFSMQILGETDPDFSSFSREKAPPVMFMPFWKPPFVVREAPGSAIIHTSLRCYPLPYFFARMCNYLVLRAHHQGPAVMCQGKKSKYSEAFKKVDGAMNKLLGSVGVVPSVDFPFYTKLMTSYIQHFCSKATVSPLVSRQDCLKLRFGTPEMMSGFAIHFPLFLWLQHFRQPKSEFERTASNQHQTVALLLSALPYLREVVSTVMPLVPKSAQLPNFSRAPAEITATDRVALRVALGTLRQVCVSLPYFFSCKATHWHQLLLLWESLIGADSKYISALNHSDIQRFVAERYEAFSCAMADIFSVMHNTDFAGIATVGVLKTFSNIIATYNSEYVRSTLEYISKSIVDDPLGGACRLVRSSLVLNWAEGEDQRQTLFPLFSSEMVSKARNACIALSKRQKESSTNGVTDIAEYCGEVIRQIEALFPSLQQPEAAEASTQREHSAPLRARRSTSGTSKVMNDEERALFLSGRASCANVGTVSDVVFCRPTYDVPDSDEFPALVTATLFLDNVILRLQKHYYSSAVRRSNSGHELHIVEEMVPCSNHSDRVALWGCRSSYKFYCQECERPPTNAHGEELRVLRPLGKNSYCSRCSLVLYPTSIAFDDDGSILCKHCAQYPWPLIKTRFLASYNGVLMLILGALFVLCLINSLTG